MCPLCPGGTSIREELADELEVPVLVHRPVVDEPPRVQVAGRLLQVLLWVTEITVIGVIGGKSDDHHHNENLPALGITACAGGLADTYPCSNVDLMAFLPLAQIGGGNGNDIWGWTDPVTGREYALVGRNDGTSFIDITDPTRPRLLGDLIGQASDVDVDETWVQAQILYRIRIYRAVPTRQPALREPTITGVETLIELAGDERQYEAVLNGRAYNVIERVIALYPQESGEIQISPARFEARVLRDGRITGRKVFTSESHTINVLPIPAPPASHPDATWLPARDVQISEEWSRPPESLEAGEPVTRRVQLSALGQIETQLPAVEPPPKDEVDWNVWLGACPWRPYNPSYVAGGWRGFYDFHTSCIGEWGAHTFAQAQAEARAAAARAQAEREARLAASKAKPEPAAEDEPEAAVPSGASTGEHEAVELRDGEVATAVGRGAGLL